MGDLVASLDVGTSKVVALIGAVEESSRVIEIVGVGKARSEGIEKGAITNPGQARESAGKALRQAEEMAAAQVDSVLLGVAGSHVEAIDTSSTVSISGGGRTITQNDVDRVIELAETSEIASDQRVIDIIPKQFIVDGQSGISNPVDMKGRRLAVELTVLAGCRPAIDNLVSCLEGLGIGVDRLIPNPMASAKAVLRTMERNRGTLLLDVGGGTTDLSIFRGGNIRYIRAIPVGGAHITKDLATKLNSSFEQAEEIKLQLGLPRDSGEEKAWQEQIQFSTVGASLHSLDKDEILDVIASRVDELFDLALEEVPSSLERDYPPTGMVLTGGTSKLEGLIDYLNRRYGMNVRIGDPPSEVEGLTDVVEDPIYATGIGLLKCGVDPYYRSAGNSMEEGSVQKGIKGWFRNLLG